jgi:carbon starvation protein
LGNRYLSSLTAVALIGFFAFYEIQGQPAGLALWSLFGSTNQVLGALTLLTITIYLRQRGSNYWYTLVPMAFMMVMTISAMTLDLQTYWNGGHMLLVFVATCIFVLSLWLVVEAYLRFRKDTVVLSQIPAPQAEGD